MPPTPPVPTRSRLLLPADACQPHPGGGPSHSMLPTLTVHPVMSVLPAGMLNVLHGDRPPASKLPFWKGAAQAGVHTRKTANARRTIRDSRLSMPAVEGGQRL